IPKGVIDTVGPLLPPDVRQVLDQRFARDQARWEAERFAQARRKADNERKLASKPTKAAAEHVRIASKKIDQLMGWISDLHRTEQEPRDWQFFTQWWVPGIGRDGAGYVIRPMRYQLRQPGKPATADWVMEKGRKRLSGTYNARRDRLEGFWRSQFGHTHALMVVDTFWENVQGHDG